MSVKTRTRIMQLEQDLREAIRDHDMLLVKAIRHELYRLCPIRNK